MKNTMKLYVPVHSHERFRGLQVIPNTMQYKCTIGCVAVQRYVDGHWDVDS